MTHRDELEQISAELVNLTTRVAKIAEAIDVPTLNRHLNADGDHRAADAWLAANPQPVASADWENRASAPRSAGYETKCGHVGAVEIETPWVIMAYRMKENGPYPGVLHHAPFSFDHSVNDHWEIYSVLRTVDSSAWKLADLVQGESAVTTIKKFSISNDNMFVYGENGYVSHLCNVKKPAPVRDWEIVEFKGKGPYHQGETWNLMPNGCWSNRSWDWLQQHKRDGCGWAQMSANNFESFTIHSVRRLADGAVFTVGEVVSITAGQSAPISAFKIEGDNIVVDLGYPFDIALKDLNKPLFTTVDGVALFNETDHVFDGKSVFEVRHALDNPGEYYSTREAAVNAQIVGTTADGVDVVQGDTIWFVSHLGIEKSKACNGVNWPRHYYTEAAALSAYNKWLYDQPVLSLQDIFNNPQGKWEQIVKDKLAKP